VLENQPGAGHELGLGVENPAGTTGLGGAAIKLEPDQASEAQLDAVLDEILGSVPDNAPAAAVVDPSLAAVSATVPAPDVNPPLADLDPALTVNTGPPAAPAVDPAKVDPALWQADETENNRPEAQDPN
jgi:hypothetical protein